ncbi:hypothetical protein [Bacillus thuringiensis]|uniref:hypothetical protein n=1 Tax=Bacillus thuringiensis TaxID=1428 RepID=UPI0021D64B26|nr:hypothetical protein [Bacillus thuringiensis]MCU7666816.1 hypothetical protein [Bacillus thuringiensis]
MRFSIIAYKRLLGLDDAFRLKNNGDWAIQQDFKQFNEEEDMLFSTFHEANLWLNQHNHHIINGEAASTERKEVYDLVNRGFEFEIICHRISRPSTPSIDELTKVLLLGDDNYNNSLVIDYDGTIKLLKITNSTPLAKDGYPVRFETFQTGNGYVGTASDLNHLEQTYQGLLENWLLHLETGRELYCDYVEGTSSIEKLTDSINKEIQVLK